MIVATLPRRQQGSAHVGAAVLPPWLAVLIAFASTGDPGRPLLVVMMGALVVVLRDLVSDIRKNPKRYFTVRLF